MANLRPCPFCGGKAHIMNMGYPHWIYCESCGAKVHGGVAGEEGEAASIRAWNRRVEQRRGHWIGIDDEPCTVYECDVCGVIYDTVNGEWDVPNYCPNCGAKMEK